MEIVYKINKMEKSVKFSSNQYDEIHKTKGSGLTHKTVG